MTRSREIILPAPGSPYWQPRGEPRGGLLYLGWGRRRYGEYAIPARLHEGWTYIVVSKGSPTLVVANKNRTLRPGDLVVAGPDVPIGWTDRGASTCIVLVWVWKSGPQFLFTAKISPKLCWIRVAGKAALENLISLHEDTRREITLADAHTSYVLEGLHRRLDAEFERASAPSKRAEEHDALRLQLAYEWMQRHLDVRSPSGMLADYLGISAMTLFRLFRDATSRSPGEVFLSMKMQEAARLLTEDNTSVKETALRLGYQHMGNFSRAFKRFHRILPEKFAAKQRQASSG